MITKSLTSLAAQFAADESLPAVWLTPLVAIDASSAQRVLAGLRGGTAPRLLVGGSEDPTWDGSTISSVPNAEVLELRGADHSLEMPGDVAASLRVLKRVTDAVGRFATQLE